MNTEKTIIAIFITIFVLALGGSLLYRSTAETVEITVIEKERVISNDASKYLIFTEDEVFENTDTFVFLKFNSSDLHRDLRVDETYTVTVVGWRIPVLSLYRNIIRIENNDTRN